MRSTFGFPTVPNTLSTARAVSTSFATATTTSTATNTLFETVRSTAYTTLTATISNSASAASGPSHSNLNLLDNVAAAYAAVHHEAVNAGTAKHSLPEQLPVLNWVLLGLVSAGAGLHLIRRYRKKTPQSPIPPGQDGKK